MTGSGRRTSGSTYAFDGSISSSSDSTFIYMSGKFIQSLIDPRSRIKEKSMSNDSENDQLLARKCLSHKYPASARHSTSTASRSYFQVSSWRIHRCLRSGKGTVADRGS
jgi:hypothetical protein